MIVVTIARKPLSEGSVAANALKHGCGGINIDACRVGTSENLSGGAYAEHGTDRHDGYENWRFKRKGGAGEFRQPTGRWPANLVLEHKTGCRVVGTKRVKAAAPASGPTLTGRSESCSRRAFNGVASTPNYSDADGMETMTAWDCKPGCPVADLDERSLDGGMHSAGAARDKVVDKSPYAASSYMIPGAINMRRLGDAGGASRFFKQVGGRQRPGRGNLEDS